MKRARVFLALGIGTVLAATVTLVWSRVRASKANVALTNHVQEIQLRAAKGDATAQAELGSAFLYGQVVKQDDAQALHWFQESANQGTPQGQCGLGWMYLHGRGVSQDDSRAIRLYKAGADAGSAPCQNGLAYFYAEGLGVPKDYNEALRWYQRAAEKGYAKAEYNLGNMYYYGTGVARDRSEASRWFIKAANRGDSYARQTIGLSFTTWRAFLIAVQVVAGLLLAFHSFSLNIWEPNGRLNDGRPWLVSATGVLCLFTAGLSWFGYKHSMIWCWIYGVTGFTLMLWTLHATTLVLLFFVLFPRNTSAMA